MATEDKKATAPKSAEPIRYDVKKNLTLPVLKMAIDAPAFIRIDEPLKIGKQIGDKDAAIIASVTDLTTGEQMQFLVPAVMQGILHDEYGAPRYGTPEKGAPVQVIEDRLGNASADAYVGLTFRVVKHAKSSGKNYHPHTVQEIKVV